MPVDEAILEVYEAGRLTVVGFGGKEIFDEVSIANCRDELLQLVNEHDCRDLAFDLTGMNLLPSGLLGVLTSLRNMGIEIHLYNPSDDIREVLQITKLDRLIQVHDLEL